MYTKGHYLEVIWCKSLVARRYWHFYSIFIVLLYPWEFCEIKTFYVFETCHLTQIFAFTMQMPLLKCFTLIYDSSQNIVLIHALYEGCPWCSRNCAVICFTFTIFKYTPGQRMWNLSYHFEWIRIIAHGIIEENATRTSFWIVGWISEIQRQHCSVASFKDMCYIDIFNKWIYKHHKCVAIGGDYLEKANLALRIVWRSLTSEKTSVCSITYLLLTVCYHILLYGLVFALFKSYWIECYFPVIEYLPWTKY